MSSRRRMRPRSPGWGLGLVPLATMIAVAAAEPPPPVLHEYLPLGDLRCAGGTCRRDGSDPAAASAGNPDGIETSSGVVSQPTDPALPLDGEQIFEPRPDTPVVAGGAVAPGTRPVDAPPERRDVIQPDLETGPEPPGKKPYHEVFNPAVFPHKRMTALDAIAADESLHVADPSLRAMPIVGSAARTPDRDAFWGSIVVDLQPSRWLPVPSPAADLRVLSYRADPPVELEFARDGAENLLVRGAARGLHRLVYLVDAPQHYFAGDLPRGARLDDEPARLVHRLPPEVAARARRVLARIGVDPTRRGQPLASVLDPLVSWFRSFEVGQLPPPSGSRYLILALARKGCCRHRSYAFFVTATAAGIPARYVENELHVYVEVYVPSSGWRLIDLGGASVEFTVKNLDGKVAYQPSGGDPFPRPEPFARNATASLASSSTQQGDGHGAGAHGAGSHTVGATSATGDATAGTSASASTSATASPTGNEPATASATARRTPTHLTVHSDLTDAFRGEPITLSGLLRAGDDSPAGLRVSLELVGAGSLRLPLGDVITDGDGAFKATVDLPRTLPLGDYHVVAHTDGDATRSPSRSTP